jgi:thymidylate synthase
VEKRDRTGIGTLSVFGHQMRFDLAHEFPLTTTKELRFKWIAHELLRFLAADSNLKHLKQHGVPIWGKWADANDERGPVYDRHWRAMRAPDGEVIDQMSKVVADIRRDPDSRRLIVPVWHPLEKEHAASHSRRLLSSHL